MKFFSRAGTVVLFLCVVAGGPAGAEVPPGPAPAQVAPAAAPAVAAVDPVKAVEIRKLLEATGTMQAVQQMVTQMLSALKDRYSQLPPEAWTHLEKEIDPSALVEKLVPVYAKYYSLDDLKAVNAFYQTPAGQHLLAAQPMVAKESLAIGQAWGHEVGMKAMMEIQDYKQKLPATPPSTNTAPQ